MGVTNARRPPSTGTTLAATFPSELESTMVWGLTDSIRKGLENRTARTASGATLVEPSFGRESPS